mmetsp:Transcript_21224/g.27108  ORF Transcript_21224/g.27108 Transcript_21224/m.27108 type:complete len:308 (+) Transcript_21224:13-936(+)
MLEEKETLTLRQRCASGTGISMQNFESDSAGETSLVKISSSSELVDILNARIERKDKELENLRKFLKKSEDKVYKLEKATKKTSSGSDDAKMGTRVKLYEKHLQTVRKALQQTSKELLEIKYGKDPIRAQVTIQFPESMGAPSLSSFTLQLAPPDVMPYSVYYWLTQVDNKLWDGCAFIRNADHVLQASAQDMNGKSLHRRFKHLPYLTESLAFQEYSANYPHEKYTLGIAGRPGGPDFYVSLVNNTRAHGPGGQSSYDLREEADSCFAKIVSGIDVIKRMHTAPRKKDSFQGLVENIGIENIKILR